MFNSQSDKVTVNAPQEVLFNFLLDLNNLQHLMPSSATEWQSTNEHCTFKLSGMATIGLIYKSSEKHTLLVFDHYGKVPFPYTLEIHFEKATDTSTISYMKFAGDVNPFMQMMVEKPLMNFFNYLTHKLEKHFSPEELV